ncbi:migration and invasion-inhibitory protein isoform X2 [Heliangelus exortis]|uniref:migration and invasion-inhibitory protein isoform X2 n=1 Tax=Heliangelus exortis TaxID=472823 RepID=UPI003A923BE1
MDVEHLQRLRQTNQDLLQRLRMKQEEMRRRLPSKPPLPAPLHSRAAPGRSVPLPRRGGKENKVNAVKSVVSVEPRAYTARATLCSSLKHSISDRGVQQQGKGQQAVGLDPSFPGKEKGVMPESAVITCGRETSHSQGSPEKEPFIEENRKEFSLLRGFHEKEELESHLDPSLSRIQSEETSKEHVGTGEPITHKPDLLTSQSKELKETAGVTLQPEHEECPIPGSSWSVLPFLGYDWIAGLLDTNSSVAEKPDQYFAELQEFRKANTAACVHEQELEPSALDDSVAEQDPDLITRSHKCVYCYRLNQRLFPVPLDSESACLVCKIPRAHRAPETLEEPVCVRVSIPSSALLPAHKYRAHRRRSLEPADSLALPVHCLAGWENSFPSSKPKLSTLDLGSSLAGKLPHHPHLN